MWPPVLVGSSMGGWIALLAALARPGRIVGLIGIAASPDLTEEIIRGAMLPDERDELAAKGMILVPSQYGEPTPITLALLEDGRDHLLMHGTIPLTCPVRLLHGQADAEVPWETALRLAARFEILDVQVMLVKGAGHRMSSQPDLLLLHTVLVNLLGLELGAEDRA